ncbi:MAG TPA: amidohydrolase [Bacteroidales bacterium]|nr:MAG: hypothetical protein A2X11_07870 [Bacteroidetes bacterium GWE2_42_24]OFY26448.1 MAG: hypothetical protein A2X09_02085 [Bacteroidetes bacterium GWF2_43_11]PKP23461.1 MAG: amidohydrolase [Bacteroidetes bacterium HGW-Bacteroidetes-22]HAQ65625.1 amidohydrolase [Bacteroidales bacterium]HBZ68152.1 amidohydrolase [Bacteroidales bacterium]
MICLKNGTYIEWQTFEQIPLDIWVEEGEGASFSFKPPDNIPPNLITIDCTGRYIMRSLGNAHQHAYSALCTGMPQPEVPPASFVETLQKIWWRVDSALDADMIRASALVTAVAAAKSGSTFVIDHHASPGFIKGSLDIIARAFDEVGISHLLCYEITDRNGLKGAREGLAETERYLSQRQGLVGLHASFTVGEQTLKEAVALARNFNTGIHVHVAEDGADENHCRQTYGKSVAERFAEAGVFELKGNIFAHGIHLNAIERRLIAKSDTWMAVNFDSNLNNGVGAFSGMGLGPRIMLGTDGMHGDMMASARTAWFSGKGYEAITPARVFQRLQMIHLYLAANKIKGNSDNNLMVLNYDSPTPLIQENFLGHWFYSLHARHIEHVIANGRLIVREGHLTTLDEAEVMAEARIQALRLWGELKN